MRVSGAPTGRAGEGCAAPPGPGLQRKVHWVPAEADARPAERNAINPSLQWPICASGSGRLPRESLPREMACANTWRSGGGGGGITGNRLSRAFSFGRGVISEALPVIFEDPPAPFLSAEPREQNCHARPPGASPRCRPSRAGLREAARGGRGATPSRRSSFERPRICSVPTKDAS